MIRLRLGLAAFLLAIGGAASAWPAAQTGGPLRGLDHVPVAVRDLAAARVVYERLGFVLKPGTPHANGLTNLHAKFPDGTEIELITAPKGVDELTRTYVTHLDAGDGPAFLALHAPDRAAAAALVPPDHPIRRYVFFGGLNHSPTDRPEHFTHPNTAVSLVSVWLAADDFSAERDLLKRAGVAVADADVLVPERVRAPVANFGRTTLVMLPGRFQRVPGRRIAGATVAVKSLDSAVAWLRKGGVRAPEAVSATGRRSIVLQPEVTNGWRLKLTEQLPISKF